VSWPRSVRARLAFWHGLALLVVVSVYAAAVLIQVRDDMYEALDGQLRGDQALAVQWLQQDLSGAVASPPAGPPPDSAAAPDAHNNIVWVDAWTPEGQRVFERGRQPGLPAPPGPPAAWPRRPAGLRLTDGHHVRTLVRPATVGGRTLYVRVGRSEKFTRQELGEFAAVLGLSLPLAFAVAVGAGYLLARRALAPVSAMTARARKITADHLEQRLPVENPNDEFGQLAGVINDALARLERAFDTLRRFTADASHELRTPLTAIRSVGEVGLRERRSDAEYREMIGSILEETERLTTMADSLLLLSRADSGRADLHPAMVGLADLAREVVADLDVLAEEKRQQIRVLAAAEVEVVADRATLRQAVLNLLDNAIKHSPEEAAIQVVVRRGKAGGVMEVVDNGPGIAAEHLPHVFERFYRADRARSRASGGAGLGLAIARWAVEANLGSIEVESEAGRGSTLPIVLPASDSDGRIGQHSGRTS
jgi:heavy metal sensor kinase